MQKESEYINKLRRDAKKKLKDIKSVKLPKIDRDKLLTELSVYHIELEMQNEQLRETQIELQKLNTKYSDLFDFAPLGYFVMDKKGFIREVNLTACNMLGLARRSLIKSTLFKYVYENDYKILYLHLQKVFAGDEREECQVKLKKKDNSFFHAQLISEQVKDGDNIDIRCRTAMIDITQRINDENILAELSEELKRSNIDLQQFADVVSHDLREPLRAITGFVELLQMKYKDKLDAKANTYIEYIMSGGKKMSNLINVLLAYSRVQSESKNFSEVSVQKSLKDAIDNLYTKIAENDATITMDKMPVVKADAVQLTQLFQNLIQNAIKFKSNRKLTIHIGCSKKENQWLFSVKDNGIGIEPRDRESIFTIFKKIHTGNQQEGSGVGLAICKRIVERHGGRIWCESEVGKGTTFYFTL